MEIEKNLMRNLAALFLAALAASLLLTFISPSFKINHSLLLSLLTLPLYLFYSLQLPKIRAKELEKDIDSNLIFAVREAHTSLQTENSLTRAIYNIAASGDSKLSQLFRELFLDIDAGNDPSLAFAKISRKTDSSNFQRFIAILLESHTNILPALSQLIQDLKRERSRKLQAYELKSQLYSRLLPLVFIGAGAFLMVLCVMGFYFSHSLPIPHIIFLNFVFLPYTLLTILADLKTSNPKI